MLKGIFSPENPVFRFIIKVGYCWWLNILWLITSIPIVTIGASTTALIYSCIKLHDDEGYATVNFFKAFKENFRQATLIWLLYACVGAVIALGGVFYNQITMAGSVLLQGMVWALGVIYVISLMYVFAIQSRFNNSVLNTIRYSLLLPFRNLRETALIAIVICSVMYFNVTTIFAVNFLTLNVGVGLIAYILAVFYKNVFDRYIPITEGIN